MGNPVLGLSSFLLHLLIASLPLPLTPSFLLLSLAVVTYLLIEVFDDGRYGRVIVRNELQPSFLRWFVKVNGEFLHRYSSILAQCAMSKR